MDETDLTSDDDFEPHRMRGSAAGPPDNSDWNTDGPADRRRDAASGDDHGWDDPDDINDPWAMLILPPNDGAR